MQKVCVGVLYSTEAPICLNRDVAISLTSKALSIFKDYFVVDGTKIHVIVRKSDYVGKNSRCYFVEDADFRNELAEYVRSNCDDGVLLLYTNNDIAREWRDEGEWGGVAFVKKRFVIANCRFRPEAMINNVAHEGGHMIGLEECYSQPCIMNRLKDARYVLCQRHSEELKAKLTV